MSTLAPLKTIVSVSYAGAFYRELRLECGHRFIMARTDKWGKRMRCYSCAMGLPVATSPQKEA